MIRYVCHQRPDRAFKLCGKPMPLCSRCTGFYPGLPAGVVLVFIITFLQELDPDLFLLLAIILTAPLALDGLTQLWKWRESNNYLRFATGILAGIGTGLLFGRILFEILG